MINWKKGLIFALFSALLLPFLTCTIHAEKKGFTVSGTIEFKQKGNLFIQMVTEEEFNSQKEARFEDTIAVDEKELQQHAARFTFKDVPAGVYAINCFQDTNGNSKLDGGMLGPKEPWGVYRNARHVLKAPKFKEMAFSVQDDITNIVINVKK
ncbi:MAG TPA: DUF2141 domain-containing protein [Bacillota bacterium]|nr:DUF2141 domain-containing protein [Bacillota bacterium]